MGQDSAEPGEPEEERPSWEPPPAVWSAEEASRHWLPCSLWAYLSP
jgi:hypothetical protein